MHLTSDYRSRIVIFVFGINVLASFPVASLAKTRQRFKRCSAFISPSSLSVLLYSRSPARAERRKMTSTTINDGRVWCPFCNANAQLLRVNSAARLVDTNRRTIYRYIEAGDIFALKVAGHSFRVCSGCLVNPRGGGAKKDVSSEKE